MRNISESLLASSSLISTGKSSGSGFILFWKGAQYLITARHVLFNEEKSFELISNTIEVSCPLNSVGDLELRRYGINLSNAKVMYSKQFDVAALLLGKLHKEENRVFSITLEPYVEQLNQTKNNPIIFIADTVKKIDEVLLSNEIFIFGFPTSLTNLNNYQFFSYDKPLLRRGIVSYVNKANSTIILDCPVYPGNSGGPVLEVSMVNEKKEYKLIGVVSRYIPYKQEWKNPRDRITNIEYLNSGYSVAIAMDEVLKLLEDLASK